MFQNIEYYTQNIIYLYHGLLEIVVLMTIIHSRRMRIFKLCSNKLI